MGPFATEIGTTVSRYTAGRFSCLCRHPRRLNRRNIVWGSLGLSLETATEEHLPNCRAAQILTSRNRSQRIALTFTALRGLLNSAVQLSFAMRQGAGGWSFSPTFTYYPTVDSKTAPAFRILSLLQDSLCLYLDRVSWRETLVPSAVCAILRLFQAREATPRAVDADNRSLVHYVTESVCPN
jgi:hypothetical protein